MNRPFLSVSRVLCLVVFLSGVAYAAIDRGAIEGTVVDPQAAVVPGVRVEVKNIATGVTTNTVTNDSGFYAVTELVPGIYKEIGRASCRERV